ncbi:hypothetical protein [uncultured Shimia sp.]|uniref:hypothetical protein n=1 Tax=uncultured Shimia sp. TaxID=573152 RepID=UPI0034543EE7
MNLIADILLVAGALGAGIYCFVLARRLSKFNDLESGVGGAVAVLSAQVDDMTRTLKAAQVTAGKSTERLEALTQRAEGVSKRLELMMAAMHDIEDAKPAKAKAAPEAETTAPEPAKEDAPVAETVSDEVEAGASIETADDEDWAKIQAEALAAEEAKLIRRAKKKAKKKAQKKAAMALAAMQAEATPAAPKPTAEAKEPEAGPMFKRHVA